MPLEGQADWGPAATPQSSPLFLRSPQRRASSGHLLFSLSTSVWSLMACGTPPGASSSSFTIIISPGSVTAARGHFFFCYKQHTATSQTEMTSPAPAPAQGTTPALVHLQQAMARPCTLPQMVQRSISPRPQLPPSNCQLSGVPR